MMDAWLYILLVALLASAILAGLFDDLVGP